MKNIIEEKQVQKYMLLKRGKRVDKVEVIAFEQIQGKGTIALIL